MEHLAQHLGHDERDAAFGYREAPAVLVRIVAHDEAVRQPAARVHHGALHDGVAA